MNTSKFSGTHGDREIFIFTVQLTTSRIAPYPVDPYSAICHDHTYIHTYIHTMYYYCTMHMILHK